MSNIYHRYNLSFNINIIHNLSTNETKQIILRHMPHMCHRTVAIFVHQFPTEKFNDRHLRRILQVFKQIFSIEQNMC